MANAAIRWFRELGLDSLDEVGGKNASLGEMINHLSAAGVDVPDGFATTASAYRDFLLESGLNDKILAALEVLDVDDVQALQKTGAAIRQWVLDAPLPKALETAVAESYAKLGDNVSVAVRSSATAEDLPEASFAGQQETFLNIQGIELVLQAIRAVYASLFTDRAIAYRVHQNFDHSQVALSAGIQRMVRSDKGASGVIFSLDTESGFEDVVFITSSYGLGELVVQGVVNPDEFYVYKPTLAEGKPAIVRKNLGSKQQAMIFTDTNALHHSVEQVDVPVEKQVLYSISDDEITELSRLAVAIEKHYGSPMDIEWGRDGDDGKLYILQARPETVQSRTQKNVLERFHLTQTPGKTLITGRSIGQRIGSGLARVIDSIDEMDSVKTGDVLVTDMTDPDWEPIMKRASAIVTNRGGRTCHAAIIARELGIPAVVGCEDATRTIAEGQAVTVSCAEGETGYIYDGEIPFEIQRAEIDAMPELPFKIMMNVGNPDKAFAFRSLPNAGIGLARLEFIINRMIGIHPQALLQYDSLEPELKAKIAAYIINDKSPTDYYIRRLKEGIATLACAFNPKPVIVRLSDFKSNEYANLIGGDLYEPDEENPMLGFRGASRYVADSFKDCFALECAALKAVREEMGLTNVQVMVPFVRTTSEAEQVIATLKAHGLERGQAGLKIIMMCELPSNALLAEDFLQYFDGFSIGSNDMTQLTLGLDRDSALIADQFDERNPAVKALLHQAILACRNAGKYIGICGQGPSDHPDFAKWLMDEQIESVSLNPDSVVDTWLFLAKES